MTAARPSRRLRRCVRRSEQGATIAGMLDADGAISENWIKVHPCCLQTHAAIDAALALD